MIVRLPPCLFFNIVLFGSLSPIFGRSRRYFIGGFQVLEGMFSLAGRLFGVSITAADGEAEVWNPDVRFFSIKDNISGGERHTGLLLQLLLLQILVVYGSRSHRGCQSIVPCDPFYRIFVWISKPFSSGGVVPEMLSKGSV